MRELIPGIHHWTVFHEPIRTEVSSYLIEPAGLIVDPRIPEGGLDALPARPEQVVMTIGLHDRDVREVAGAFGIPVRAPEQAAGRLAGEIEFDPYGDGDEIAPGATAIHIGGIADDEYALHLAIADGALAFADGLIRYGGELQFVPDNLLGDDPERVKSDLRRAFAGLLDRDFDHLLFAHGEPLIGGGKEALREFVEG